MADSDNMTKDIADESVKMPAGSKYSAINFEVSRTIEGEPLTSRFRPVKGINPSSKPQYMSEDDFDSEKY